MTRICLNPLTKRYGPVLAVGDFTVTLQPGKIAGSRGPNGAGTTTTLGMPVELIGPTPGTPIIADSTPRTGRGDRPIRCALADVAARRAGRRFIMIRPAGVSRLYLPGSGGQ